jgi:ABC-2 type transport system permease protein
MDTTNIGKEKSGVIAVCKRELHLIVTNVCLMLLIFAAPLVYPFLYNSIYMNKFERDVPISIVDLDHTQCSRQFIRNLDAHELITVSNITENVNAAYEKLQDLQAMGIVIIPSGFEKQQKKKLQSKIHVATNNTRFMVASDINRAVADIISNYGYTSTTETFQKAGFSTDQAKKNGGTNTSCSC